MKKIFALLAIVAMLSGCAYLKIGKQILCNPTPDQQAQAQKAGDFLDMAAGFVGGPVQVAYLAAKGTFLLVRPGFCVGLDQLEQALASFDEAQKIVMGKLKGTDKMIAIPDVSALRIAVKK